MLENPEKLQEMIARTGAKSTDLQCPESAAHLCGKCEAYAKGMAAGGGGALVSGNGKEAGKKKRKGGKKSGKATDGERPYRGCTIRRKG